MARVVHVTDVHWAAALHWSLLPFNTHRKDYTQYTVAKIAIRRALLAGKIMIRDVPTRGRRGYRKQCYFDCCRKVIVHEREDHFVIHLSKSNKHSVTMVLPFTREMRDRTPFSFECNLLPAEVGLG